MAEETKQNGKESMLKKACKDYGIDAQYILKSRETHDKKGLVIITVGGAKVRWYPNDKDIQPLDPVRVDGKIRKKMKPVTGDKKARK